VGNAFHNSRRMMKLDAARPEPLRGLRP
jgi:hypothetical protein